MVDPAIEQLILQKLVDVHRSSGLIVGDFAPLIARQPGRESNRKHSAFVAAQFLDMEARGLIRRADDQKPILWQIADGAHHG